MAVTNESELDQDLAENAGGTGSCTITLGSGFTLDTDMPAVNLRGGSLTQQGAWKAINGAGSYRGRSAFLSSRVLAAMFAGAVLLFAPPALAKDYLVGSDTQLADAINDAGAGDTITFTENITLSSNLSPVTKGITIRGDGFTLSGNNQARGLFVPSGDVAISNLTIANAKAQGGRGGNANGGGGGGGGAGLGGALFIGAGAVVTLSNVKLLNDLAVGGDGGFQIAGCNAFSCPSGGGGGYWPTGANGGDAGIGTGGGGTGGGGDGGYSSGGAGGFGGGGGGCTCHFKGNGPPGAGGFGGGGGGGGSNALTGVGGFGGGSSVNTANGGGGAGLGGAIFVQLGGALVLPGGLTISGGSVAGGTGGAGGHAQPGKGFGSGIFLQGNGTLHLDPGAGQTQTIADAIADETGSVGSGGSWQLVKHGAGTTILTGANAYSHGTTVLAGTLEGTTNGLQGNIVNDAALVFDQNFDGTYDGILAGSGTLEKDGVGRLTLTDNDQAGGGTSIQRGTLALIRRLTSNVTVYSNGTLIGGGNVDGKIIVEGGKVDPGVLGSALGTMHIEGAYSQTGGTITFDIDPNGDGGFLESALQFAPGDLVSITGAKIAFDFMDGANPLAFLESGAFNLDTFFKESNGSLFSDDFNLQTLFASDSFTLNVPHYDISGFGANGAVNLVPSPVPEPSSLVTLIPGLVGLVGFAGLRRVRGQRA